MKKNYNFDNLPEEFVIRWCDHPNGMSIFEL